MSLHCDLGLRAEYCPTRIDPKWPEWFGRKKPKRSQKEINLAKLAKELNINYQALRHYALKLFPGKSYIDYTDADVTALREYMKTVKIKRPMKRKAK